MKHSIQNFEYRIQKARNAQRGADAVGGTQVAAVPAGRTGYGADFRCRFATHPSRGRKVGKGGKTAAKKVGFSRLFAPFPGISHLFPLGFFCQVEQGVRSQKGRRGGIMWEKVRIITGSFTKVRTDQGRGYAMLRIVTGETNFWPRMKHRSNTDARKGGRLTTDGHE